jgi:integrase
MIAHSQTALVRASGPWKMPIVAEHYDRSPLTAEERRALERSLRVDRPRANSQEARAMRRILTRFDVPVADVYYLRHRGYRTSTGEHTVAQNLMRQEMHRHGKMFWDWSEEEWLDTLCPTTAAFSTKHRVTYVRTTVMDLAYLFGNVTDLRAVDIKTHGALAAKTYFGSEWLVKQSQIVVEILAKKGFSNHHETVKSLRQCLYLLFILNRSPYLEDITPDSLTAAAEYDVEMRHACGKIHLALQHLGILPHSPKKPPAPRKHFENSGMAQEWYEWCIAWDQQEVNLTPRTRHSYTLRLLVVGRWLAIHAPDVREPAQWTEDLALRFGSDVCSWTIGQYASGMGKHIHALKGKLDHPMKAATIESYLSALRFYLADLVKRPYVVGHGPGRKITLDFAPREALATPRHIQRALDVADPRDIDLRVWAKLAIAAATLSQSDLPEGSWYPLSFYRALGLLWVTSARRPNEIARLRLDCVREEWDPEMLNADEQLPGNVIDLQAGNHYATESMAKPGTKLFYLHIPSGKTRGPFWIWIPDYVVDAINEWKRERPANQRVLHDRKDQEAVEYLFCYKDTRIGDNFINTSLIPALCAKAGVESQDARGRISGHRGRSTRLTLLRQNGVGLDDLAEYAGHKDSTTIRRYARHNPLQLHRIIKDADDISRIIEGVVDVRVAAQGLPALRWFIGYDADAEPQYCANQVYHTCPHRLDCPKCGMFIGGEKARLLQTGENTLPITSKVPMTPIEKCVVTGDQAGVAAYRAALKQVPAPETPDLTLIFNPEGLSNHELEKLARLATAEALNKLRQALDAHTKRLAEAQQQKTGRNAIVGAQKKRVSLLQQLLAESEQQFRERQKDQEQSLS